MKLIRVQPVLHLTNHQSGLWDSRVILEHIEYILQALFALFLRNHLLKHTAACTLFAMLILISSDCYKVGSFFYAAKAYDVLERLDAGMDHWEGKQGACCGVFQQVIAKKERKERLKDVLNMLQNNATIPQAALMVRVMENWLNSN
jgi:hypothetical protein